MFGKIRNASVTASPSKATCSSKLCDVCQAGKQHESRRLIKKQLQSLICLILRVWILTLHEGMQQQEVTTFKIWLWQIRFDPGTRILASEVVCNPLQDPGEYKVCPCLYTVQSRSAALGVG